MAAEVWLVWGCSHYADHDVEAVFYDEARAEAHATALENGDATSRREYDLPQCAEFWVSAREVGDA